MELAVEIALLAGVVGGAQRGVQRLRPGEMRRREACHRSGEQVALDQGAQFVGLPQHLGGQHRHEGAAVGAHDH